MIRTFTLPAGVEVLGDVTPQFAEILTPQALAFTAKLARKFEPRPISCRKRKASAILSGPWRRRHAICRTAA